MRVSIYQDDAGYENFRKHQDWIVFVDSKPIPQCVLADEADGIAIAHVLDANGQVVVDWERREIMTHTVRGRVEILRSHQL